jgi:hypothetical protein
MVIRVRIRRRVRKPKPGFFTLKAEPRLRQDGPLRGYLDYVIFTAHTTGGRHYWHAHRHGNFIADFSALVPEEEAINMVRDLHSGQAVELPGRHRLELLQGRFGFNGLEPAG